MNALLSLLLFAIWGGAWYGIARFARSKGVRPWLSHVAGAPFGLIVSLIVVAIFLPAKETTQTAVAPATGRAQEEGGSKPEKASRTIAAIPITARDLFIEYHSNEVAADVKYKGKSLAVTGMVDEIGKDFLDNVYVALRTPNPFMSARAQLVDSEHGRAAQLKRGQKIMVLCVADGLLVGSPVLSECKIVEREARP